MDVDIEARDTEVTITTNNQRFFVRVAGLSVTFGTFMNYQNQNFGRIHSCNRKTHDNIYCES